MASVAIRDVRKAFGAIEVIHGVDVLIDDGEFVVLVGPSGCGKSTLLRMIAGLENITSGEIRFRRRPPGQEEGGEVVDLAQLPPRGALMRDIRGGEKNWHHIKRGVPLRAEIGPKDIAKNGVFLARRDTGEKAGVAE